MLITAARVLPFNRVRQRETNVMHISRRCNETKNIFVVPSQKDIFEKRRFFCSVTSEPEEGLGLKISINRTAKTLISLGGQADRCMRWAHR